MQLHPIFIVSSYVYVFFTFPSYFIFIRVFICITCFSSYFLRIVNYFTSTYFRSYTALRSKQEMMCRLKMKDNEKSKVILFDLLSEQLSSSFIHTEHVSMHMCMKSRFSLCEKTIKIDVIIFWKRNESDMSLFVSCETFVVF